MISAVIPVYRNARGALALVETLSQQRLPRGSALEIIVVDDGSGDNTADTLRTHGGDALRIVALPENSGRGNARNAGANESSGYCLAFIDCDCRPDSADFLAAHVRILDSGCIASCGYVVSEDTSFWTRYQQQASARRENQHRLGITFSGTTANFVVRKEAYAEVGGFDPRYRRYGFEDRDLLARLAKVGEIGWCTDAGVTHMDQLTLPGVLSKMQQAGGESAQFFSQDHPEAYRRLGYAAIDTRLNPWLRPFAAGLSPLLRSAEAVERLIEQPWMPYPLSKTLVKLLTALAFARGSLEDQ